MNGSGARRNGRSKRGNGEGSIYRRRSDGRWVGAVVGPDGSRRYFYGTRRRDVQPVVDIARSEAASGLPPETSQTIGSILTRWLVSVKPTVRPSTYVSYEGHVRIHLAPLHAIPAAKLGPPAIRRLQDDLLADGLAPRTISYSNSVLRMALKQAVSDGILRRNVAQLVKPPRIPGPSISALTGDELASLLRCTPDPIRRALWAVCGGLGLRLGEALGLRWSDVHPDGSLTVAVSLRPIPGQPRGQRLQLVQLKTDRSRRTLIVPSFVAEAIEAVPRRGILVFTTPRGTALDPRNVLRLFKQDLDGAGLDPIRIHDLRHTAATLMLSSGTDLLTVRDVLGHSNIATTAVYAHVVPAMRLEAARRMDAVVSGITASELLSG